MIIKNMLENGGYTINVNVLKKSMDISVKGAFTTEQATQFHTDYEKQVKSIKAEDFTLNIDCTDMQVINQEMIPLLTHSYELYKSSGFGKVQFNINKNAILKIQLSRIARTVGLPNYEVVEL